MQNKSTSDKVIIGIAGELLAGKTTASEFYIQNFDAKHLKFSRLLDQILTVLNLPINRQNEQDIAILLKELYGNDVLANALAEIALRNNKKFILFDGLREYKEVAALKNALPNFKMIYISAKPETRYERMKSRFEKPEDSTQTYEQFLESQKHAADVQIQSLKQYADYIVNNDTTLQDFQSQLTAIFTQEAK